MVMDKRLRQFVQRRIGDKLRLAHDPRCQDLLEKLEGLRSAREAVMMLHDTAAIGRRTNYWLCAAIEHAETIAYYSHYLFDKHYQETHANAFNAARAIRDKSLGRD